MGILKGLALSFLSFLLFLSLSIFGLALTLNSTVLSADFITSQLDELDVSSLTEEIINEQMTPGEDMPEELTTAILDTIPDLEPVIKEQVNATITDTYDYLLGRSEQPDLKTILGNTFLNSQFVSSVLETLDLSLLLEQFLPDETAEGDFPEAFRTALISTITELEPSLKEKISAVADPIFKYLLGKQEQPGLKTALGDTFLSSDFISSVLDKLDLPLLVEEVLPGQEGEEEFSEEFITALVDTITELEAEIKQKVAAATDPIFDYLLGETESIDLAPTLRNTILTSDFVLALIDKMAIFSLASESLGGELTEQIPEEMAFLTAYLDDLMPELQSTIREQISAAADPLLDYLLGQRESINIVISLEDVVQTLEDSLREHLLELPPEALKPRFKEILTEQITEAIPAEVEHLADHIVTDEWIDEQVNIAINPILRYLLGESQSLNVVISLGTVVENLREPVKEEFLESPPPELAGLPSAQIEQHFDEYFEELTQDIPTTVVIDESTLGADLPAQIDEFFGELSTAMPRSIDIGEMLAEIIPAGQVTDALAEAEEGLDGARQGITEVEDELGEVRQDIDEAITKAEEGLEEARTYVGYYQLGYKILIGLIGLLILSIVLIHHQVKGATRGLGIVFLIYGAIEYTGILVGKGFANTLLAEEIAKIDIPAAVQGLPLQLLDAFTAPIQTLSLGLLIGGIVLVVVSFVYPRLRQPAS